VITFFEEKLSIRNVYFPDFENRVKKFVYSTRTVKLKQLKEAFAGDTNLELIVNDKDCLDWRILFSDIFLDQRANEEAGLDPLDMEDDENLCFVVPYLLLYGILYCQCEP
jgi:hypothetical protein